VQTFRWITLVIAIALGASQAAEAPQKPELAGLDALLKDLGNEDFAVREKASKGLMAAGASAKVPLEKLSKDSTDLEVRERAKSILRALNMSHDYAALSADERSMAKLPFESKITDNGKTVSFKNYGNGNAFVCDFGNIRVCVADTAYNGMSSGSFSVGAGGGSSSIKAGSFSVNSANGVTNISFRTLNWKVEKDIMKIASQEVAFGGYAHKIVFLDKAGNFVKRCDIPEDADPEKK
jgi:hypothetical protein